MEVYVEARVHSHPWQAHDALNERDVHALDTHEGLKPQAEL